MAEAPLIAGIELGGTKCIAILASGPGSLPGFVATSKATASTPWAPQPVSGSGATRVRNFALSSLSGGNSRASALSSLAAAALRAADSARAAAR